MSQQYLSRIHQQPHYNVCKRTLTLPQPSPVHYPPPSALAWHHCPSMHDPTDPTMVYSPHIPQNTTYPDAPLCNVAAYLVPALHTTPLTLTTRSGLEWTRREGWDGLYPSHMYPQVASAWVHPATMSRLYHSDGTKLTGPVIPAMRFLEDTIW